MRFVLVRQLMSSQVRPLNAALTSDAGMTLQFTMSGCRPGQMAWSETCCFRDRCEFGGASRGRTDDLMLAKHALSQLSYAPVPENTKLGC